MAIIRPFKALRPPVIPAERASQVASVPYDVVNRQEARALAEQNEYSFLHISRPEIDLPDSTDIYSEEVYVRAAQNFQLLIKAAPLKIDKTSSLYIYQLQMGSHVQTGIAATFSIDEYDTDIIRKHEKTRRDKEDDRTRHIVTLRAQTGPVFLTYPTDHRIDTLTEDVINHGKPLYDFTASDGVRHTIWKVLNNDVFVKAFAHVQRLYIADGHHRAASASRARATLRNENPVHTGTEDYNFFLAVIFPSNQVKILPYNRVVQDLNGLSIDELFARIGEKFSLTENALPHPPAPGNWSMYLNSKWYGLVIKDGVKERLTLHQHVAADTESGIIDGLDVSILQAQVLEPVLGINDVRSDKRIDFVGGMRGTQELERLVNNGHAAVAFSLYPTTVDDLIRVSNAGEIMPPKSTWFEPKLRDGLLIYQI